ncbi:hypothetical protein [Mucilaginibacter sp. dw_454]|uniref:hypothetical protein n=1 Tax=Mucilaginibacter sp. dw_454 TaxID=2720079 RepID=UPI001BD5BAA1|nr:hypothetical protein [Mucilaginibacter sp. dw_454]
MLYHQKPTIGSILAAAINFIAQNWKQLLICYLKICTLFVLPVIVFNYFNPFPVLPHVKHAFYETPDFSFDLSSTEIIRRVLGGIGSAAIAVMTLVYIRVYFEIKEQPSVAQVWAGFKAKYVGCLIAFALFNIVVQLGFKFYYLPGIYLMPVSCLFMAIMGLEDLPLLGAVKKSFAMIIDSWWLTFGAVLITALALAIPLAIIHKTTALTLTKPAIALIDMPLTYIYDFLFVTFFVAVTFCYLALSGRVATTVTSVETDDLDPLEAD